jgi:uncharacterized protein DUF2848
VTLAFDLATDHATLPIQVPIRNLVIAGWTGRDRAAVDAHIRELAEIGVAPPRRVPIFYRVSASLLTQADVVQVLGSDSSGEVEFVLVRDSEGLLVSIGSDHTDRKVETVGVALSKQICPKPLASNVWEFASVDSHWDELILRSYILEGGRRVLYQQGSAAAILHPRSLLESYGGADGLDAGTAMFCGTLPAIGGVRSAGEFCMELEDPVAQRKIFHRYTIEPLPIEA